MSVFRFLRCRVILAVTLLGSWSGGAVAQGVSDPVIVDVRAGAKVNVRAEPEVMVGNVVGKALGGDRGIVLEIAEKPKVNWFKVRGTDRDFEGWIRGDLISLDENARPVENDQYQDAGQINSTDGETAQPTSAPAGKAFDRPDWAGTLIEYIDAVRSCVETGSAQPSVASGLKTLPRGLIEVDVLDAADRQWKCVVRVEGGTPLRFDPMFSGGISDSSKGTFFASVASGRPEQNSCAQIEEIGKKRGDGIDGWLIYTDCP